MTLRSSSRIKTKTVQVRATPAEKEFLKARADAFGISVGELCRQTIFRATPKAKTDLEAIQALAVARTDLTRLGNLFKGWLAGAFPAGPQPDRSRVCELLHEIETAKNVLVHAAKALGKLS